MATCVEIIYDHAVYISMAWVDTRKMFPTYYIKN